MKIVFFGTGAFGIPSLEALRQSTHEILAVVTAADKPQGRSLKPFASPVKSWAAEHQTTVFHYLKLNSEEAVGRLKELAADLFVVIDFGIILSKELLAAPRVMAVNVHGSLLPRHRGAAPVPWTILGGDAQTGVSVIRMTEKLDAGDILVQRRTPVSAEDDAVTLEDKLSELGAEALVNALEKIEKGSAHFQVQDESLATYARKLSKSDGRIDWGKPAHEIVRHVRAMNPWPGTHTFSGGKRMIVLKAGLAEKFSVKEARPGSVIAASEKEGLVVAAGGGAVRIADLQLEGKRPLAAAEFLKGFRLATGAILE